MTERVLGERGSKRRKHFLLLPVLATTVLALFWIAGAQAVHQLPDSSFELDRNAINDVADPRDDWENVFTNTDSADVSTGIVNDPADATIFTGGGSKDDLDIPNWNHKSGSVPPKDEITNAYAALYQVGSELRLYFGADRFANNGSSQIGFWFFQNTVDDIAGGTFSGVHDAGEVPHNPTNPGDILILSDFTQGGAISTIRVFEWVGSGGSAGTVNQVAAGVDCLGAVHPPDLCGTVNSANTPAPWPYTPKFGTAGTFPPGSIYEGGVDLTAFGFENVCFSSFLAETRSSPSVDATLKDFVLGAFPTCGSSTVTTPVDGSGATKTTINLGESISDKATVTGTGLGGNPTGSVAFRVCGPFSTPTACPTSDPPTPFSTKTLSGTSNPVSVTSDPVTPAHPGTYCFSAVYIPAPDSPYPGSSDNDTSRECFVVNKLLPGINTTPSSTSITLGQTVSDHAVLTGTAAGGHPTGTIDFYICSPSQLTPVNTGTCTSGGTLVSNDVTVTQIGSTNSSQADSASFEPTSTGRWCWRGEYSGDEDYLPNSDSDESECLSVVQVPTTISTAPFVYPNDTAHLEAAAGGNISGTVTFKLYGSSADCTADTNVLFTEAITLAGNAMSYDLTTHNGDPSDTVTDYPRSADALTGLFWRVSYNGVSPHVPINSVCVEKTIIDNTNDPGPGT